MAEYVSKNPGLQLIIRDQVINPMLSLPNRPHVEKPVLTVEFGQYGAAIRPTSPTGQLDEFGNAKTIAMRHEFGNEMIYADFRGGFIDLEAMIEDKQRDGLWDDEDADLVRRTMQQGCSDARHPFYGDYSEHTPNIPAAPWPTYDEMPAEAIPEFAAATGLLVQAIYYETVTAGREDVLKALNDKAEQAQALQAPDEG